MKCMKWMNWHESIVMSDGIETHELKRMNTAWIDMNELKRMNWHEWIEVSDLTWLTWNEGIETNELN